jgi:hypothetical protein
MLTFAITLDTGEGRATIYTDEIEQFLEAFDVELAPRQPCQMQAWDGELRAPYLKGYAGPFVKGKTETGDLIVGYSEKIDKTQCAIEAVRKMGGR